MKNIVVFDEYNEIDFKPSQALAKYIDFTSKDVISFFIKSSKLVTCLCPACGSKRSAAAFEKLGLKYQECLDCCSLYVSPRPKEEALKNYYAESKARAFWMQELSKMTDKKRRDKIIKPRFEWIVESTREHLPQAKHLVDINTASYGYVDEMIADDFFSSKTLLEPFLKPQPTAVKIVNESEADQLANEVDVISAFEVIDHTSDVDRLMSSFKRMLNTNGLVFLTAILSSGFDVQTLWAKSDNIYPPDRLNVLSLEGFYKLFEKHGFECLEFSTPGILDLEIVSKTAKQHPDFKTPRFIDYLLKHRNQEQRHAFREFLQANLLSSYGRIVIRRK